MSVEARLLGTILGLGIIPVQQALVACEQGQGTPEQQRILAKIVRAAA